MPVAVTVNVRGLNGVRRLVDKLPSAMDEDVGESMFVHATTIQQSLQKELMRTSKRFDWKIYGGIKAKKLSKYRSIVNMPKEGFMLDGMKPHWVSLKRGRNITRWAMDRFNKPFRELPGAIRVRPHPFINKGLANARNRLPKEIKKGVNKAFRRSRK